MVASTSNLSTGSAARAGGLIVEWARYSAYGIPFGLPGGDTDSDGDCDSTDITQIQTWIDASAYDVRGDINLDGSVNATDKSLAISNYQGTTSGWNVLSAAVVANRIGYAGYQKDINLDHYHVRNRVYSPELGRWTRRDPLGYVDGMSTYEYARSRPAVLLDGLGLWVGDCGSRLIHCPKGGPDPANPLNILYSNSKVMPGPGGTHTFQLDGKLTASDVFVLVFSESRFKSVGRNYPQIDLAASTNRDWAIGSEMIQNQCRIVLYSPVDLPKDTNTKDVGSVRYTVTNSQEEYKCRDLSDHQTVVCGYKNPDMTGALATSDSQSRGSIIPMFIWDKTLSLDMPQWEWTTNKERISRMDRLGRKCWQPE